LGAIWVADGIAGASFEGAFLSDGLCTSVAYADDANQFIKSTFQIV
jgi:hypothetical protein